MALAGGVAIALPRVGYLYQEGLIFSPDGHCRPFSSRAQGTTGGEGVGLVVLKRLEDARADGDHIRAVIRGAAINNDGSARRSASARRASTARRRSVADRDGARRGRRRRPHACGYVEAHGTGTPLGDPIEIKRSDARVPGAIPTTTGFCGVGSVKSEHRPCQCRGWASPA